MVQVKVWTEITATQSSLMFVHLRAGVDDLFVTIVKDRRRQRRMPDVRTHGRQSMAAPQQHGLDGDGWNPSPSSRRAAPEQAGTVESNKYRGRRRSESDRCVERKYAPSDIGETDGFNGPARFILLNCRFFRHHNRISKCQYYSHSIILNFIRNIAFGFYPYYTRYAKILAVSADLPLQTGRMRSFDAAARVFGFVSSR